MSYNSKYKGSEVEALLDKVANGDVGGGSITEETVSGRGFTKNTGTYSKPSGGIPKSDLESAVQTSLGKADTALQTHQDISGKQDKLVSGSNIKTINGESILGGGNITIVGGSEEGEGGVNAPLFGICSNSAGAPNKTVQVDDSFTLENNARVSILFTASNLTGNLTLNVNETGAYPISWKNSNSAIFIMNQVYDFLFYNEKWYLLGGIDTDTTTDVKVTQYVTSASTNKTYPLLFTYAADRTVNGADYARFATDLKYNPATKELTHGGLSFKDSNGNTLGLPAVSESTTLVDKVYVDNIVGDISTILDNLNGEEV